MKTHENGLIVSAHGGHPAATLLGAKLHCVQTTVLQK